MLTDQQLEKLESICETIYRITAIIVIITMSIVIFVFTIALVIAARDANWGSVIMLTFNIIVNFVGLKYAYQSKQHFCDS